jgi:uncharacterized protein (TIGR00255 family)
MTGFGRAEFEVDGSGFALELRTVNHRHLDVSVRLPRSLQLLETELRRGVAAHFSRGKVDVSVTAATAEVRQQPELDRPLARQYAAFAEELTADGAAGSHSAAELLGLPGVVRLSEQSPDPEGLRAPMLAAAERAATAAGDMRQAEGEALERDLRGRLDRVAALAETIAQRSDEVVQLARERLRRRAEQLREVTGLLDEARLHQEVVIAADRLDVSEEVVRLRSHAEQFCGALDQASAEPVGRRLDFLLQEMGREVNTIGSKAGDASVAHRVVDLKTELERIREQVQNVE